MIFCIIALYSIFNVLSVPLEVGIALSNSESYRYPIEEGNAYSPAGVNEHALATSNGIRKKHSGLSL